MLNKKNILSAAALVCALAALALSVFAIGALGRQAEEIQALKQENTQLQTRLEEVRHKQGRAKQEVETLITGIEL